MAKRLWLSPLMRWLLLLKGFDCLFFMVGVTDWFITVSMDWLRAFLFPSGCTSGI